MKRRTFLLTSVALVVSLGAASAAPQHQLLNVTFQTQLPLSQPEKVGNGAARAFVDGFEVLVVEIGPEQFSALQAAGQNPYEYARVTYLGVTSAASERGSRRFVQGPQYSEIWPQSFPNKDYLEVFWLERKLGAGLLLAFRVAPGFDWDRAGQAMDEICSSLSWRL